jgi:hypothetical protein
LPIQFGNVTPDGNTFFVNTELLLEKYSGLYKYLSSIQVKNIDVIKSVKIYRKRVKEILGKVSDFTENEPRQYLNSSQIILDKSSTINKITILEEDVGIGKYCYGVELVVSDILKKDMEIVLEELKVNNTFLTKYLEQANIKDIHYDSEKNRFTQKFQNKYENNLEITKSVEVYIEALFKVSSVSSFPQEIKKELIC